MNLHCQLCGTEIPEPQDTSNDLECPSCGQLHGYANSYRTIKLSKEQLEVLKNYNKIPANVDFKELGFKDGFLGGPARAVSNGYDQQAAYLDAFSEGRKHREKVDEVTQIENISVNEVLRKAFEFYYQSVYGEK